MAFEFRYRRMVQWVDTDAAGIIHFSNYFRYMEEAELAFYRQLGLTVFDRSKPHSVMCPRVSAQCDFRKTVTYGDELDIHLWVAKMGRSSIGYEFSFRHNGDEAARGRVTIACVTRDASGELASAPIPEEFRSALEPAPFASESAES